jgi:hypothetical protein
MIAFGTQGVLGKGLPETGPARAGIKLGVGTEKLAAAAYTTVGSILLTIPVLARIGGFSTFVAANLELLRGELLTPFLIRLGNFVTHF